MEWVGTMIHLLQILRLIPFEILASRYLLNGNWYILFRVNLRKLTFDIRLRKKL